MQARHRTATVRERPLRRYLITFACYGSHLPGEPTAVDRSHNVPGGRFAPERPGRAEFARKSIINEPYTLAERSRTAVLTSIGEVCAFRHWRLFAVHVRTNHVHVVVESNVAPEIAMNAFKSYASRVLNAIESTTADRRRWARHGSTVTLYDDDAVRSAIRYVVEKRGERLSVFEAEWK